MSTVCGEKASLHVKGVKDDKHKTDLGLLFESFPRAIRAVADVASFGANKYTRNGWVTVENGYERYNNALLRHKLSVVEGEITDSESGLLHDSHACWNALATLELRLRGQL